MARAHLQPRWAAEEPAVSPNAAYLLLHCSSFSIHYIHYCPQIHSKDDPLWEDLKRQTDTFAHFVAGILFLLSHDEHEATSNNYLIAVIIQINRHWGKTTSSRGKCGQWSEVPFHDLVDYHFQQNL